VKRDPNKDKENSMSLIKAERTTTINYDDLGDNAEIVTYSKTLINSLRKNPAAKEVEQLSEGGVIFRITKKLINVRKPRKGTGRTWTPEQRQAAAARMTAARAAKQEG
jgi:hypothetical protein